MPDVTVPSGAARMAVAALKVTVAEGPDAGKSATSRGETVRIGTATDNDLVLSDPTVSGYHVVLEPTEEGVRVADGGSTNGTRVGAVMVERAIVPLETALRIGRTTLRIDAAGDIELPLHGGDTLADLRGRSPAMRRLMEQIERAAQSDVSVLVTGESGTGKELVARALHDLGPRKDKPFVTVDCGSLAPSLVASELFGHEKGAFTGAERQHVGAFEQAEGGTIFLDEIGELPKELQANLLGALERRRIKRVGGRSEIAIDVRVVSATHRDLRTEVNAGSFRLDLYYRLAVVALAVPALRERAEDIPLLVRHFLDLCGWEGKTEALFPAARLVELCAQRWEGNVRELRNVVEAAVAMGGLSPSTEIAIAAPPSTEPGADLIGSVLDRRYKDARGIVLEQFEERYLRHLMARTQNNVSRASREAGLDRSHLTQLVQKHKLR